MRDADELRANSRWAGRNPTKTALRNRVWRRLATEGVNVGPTFDRIPNFVGADAAAKRLSELHAWKTARVVKCNPDPPQIPVRLRALYDGKLLFAPVPYLTKGFPYLRIDPEKLAPKGVDFETAATAQGFHGARREGRLRGHAEARFLRRRVRRGHVGAAGAPARALASPTSSRASSASLAWSSDSTPIATTVHSSQVVDDSEVVMEATNSALAFIATELELIETETPFRQPAGVAWDKVRPDQFADIPFLSELRIALEARKRAP